MFESEIVNCNQVLRSRNLRVRVQIMAKYPYELYRVILDNLDNGKEVVLNKQIKSDEVEDLLWQLENFGECLELIS